MKSDRDWKVEKSIPIALIITIAVQTVGVAWWASNLTSRVEQLERQMSGAAWQAERIIRLDERLNTVQTGITELKLLVQRGQSDKGR